MALFGKGSCPALHTICVLLAFLLLLLLLLPPQVLLQSMVALRRCRQRLGSQLCCPIRYPDEPSMRMS